MYKYKYKNKYIRIRVIILFFEIIKDYIYLKFIYAVY